MHLIMQNIHKLQAKEMENAMGIASDWTSDSVAPLHTLLYGLPKNTNTRVRLFAERIRNVCR